MTTAAQVRSEISMIDTSTARHRVPEIHTLLEEYASLIERFEEENQTVLRDKVTPEDFGIGVSSLDQMQCYKHYSNYLQAELENERAKVIHCVTCGDSWFDSGFTTSCPICSFIAERKARDLLQIKVDELTTENEGNKK